MAVDTWPADGSSPVFIRGYRGGNNYEDLIETFHRDAVLLLGQGYAPAGQHYVEGEWSVSRAVLAILIGLLFWAQMLVHRPIGTLTVTYVHRASK